MVEITVCPLLLIGRTLAELQQIREGIKKDDPNIKELLSCYDECGWKKCGLCGFPQYVNGAKESEFQQHVMPRCR